MVPGYSDFLPQAREINKKCERVFVSGVDREIDGNALHGSDH